MKEQILKVGCELWSIDPARVGLREIARILGCNHGTITYYFGGIKGLKLAIAEYAVKTGNSKVIGHLILTGHDAIKDLPSETRESYIRTAAARA